MDFTELYKHSSHVAFSPGSQFILAAASNRLVVRRTDSFQITSTWLVEAAPTKPPVSISHIGWSCDSEYIFAACASVGLVAVYKLNDDQWNARIEAGAEGLVRAEWAPDGRTILCTSEWGLRITAWSLATGLATYIQYPIHSDRGYAFRADGRYFALVERHKSKDTLGVYDASQNYTLVRHFPLPTSSASSIALSPTGNYLALWEGPIEYKLYIVTLAGSIISSFCPEPDPGFGIRTAVWHPAGTFIAVSGRDDKIHFLDNMSWSSVVTLELSSKIPASTVWREPSNWYEATEGRGFLSYERLHGVQTLSLTRADTSKPYPKSGAVQLEWNKSGTLLLVRFDNTPTVVHIYDFPTPESPFMPRLRAVLIHSKPVLQARWNPVRSGSLALCCGAQSIFTWSDEWVNEEMGASEDMAECIGIPAQNFECRDLKWSPDGKGLVLMDKEVFCCAFEVEDDAA